MNGNMAIMLESRELATSFPGFAHDLTSSQGFPEVSNSKFPSDGWQEPSLLSLTRFVGEA
jgi:hypothetical protein